MNLKEDHEQGGVCWCGQEHEVIGVKIMDKWQKENFGTKAARPSFTQHQTNKTIAQGAQDAGMIRPDPISHAIELKKSISQQIPEPIGNTPVAMPLEKLLGLKPGFTHNDLKAAIIRHYGRGEVK